jgi:3,4-dihydroxy-2-butanone 4-phosphate synthase
MARDTRSYYQRFLDWLAGIDDTTQHNFFVTAGANLIESGVDDSDRHVTIRHLSVSFELDCEELRKRLVLKPLMFRDEL